MVSELFHLFTTPKQTLYIHKNINSEDHLVESHFKLRDVVTIEKSFNIFLLMPLVLTFCYQLQL